MNYSTNVRGIKDRVPLLLARSKQYLIALHLTFLVLLDPQTYASNLKSAVEKLRR